MINNIHLDLSQKAEKKHYTFIFASNADKINILIMINNIYLDLSQKAERKLYNFTLVKTLRK